MFFIICRINKDILDNKKDIHFKNKDVEVTTDAFNKIGGIKKGTPNEVVLNLQNIENNKEIFSLEKRIEKLEEVVDFLQEENAELNAECMVLKTRVEKLAIVGGNNVIN